jgi:hypothetical protein
MTRACRRWFELLTVKRLVQVRPPLVSAWTRADGDWLAAGVPYLAVRS